MSNIEPIINPFAQKTKGIVKVPAPKQIIIKENIDDLIPPGLIFYFMYLTGDPTT